MMKCRGFEVISQYKNQNIRIPVRKTQQSAGYDIESAEDIDLLPGKVTIVKTGLKAYMQPDEYLALHVRSGISIKHGILLINSTGIIDADYYNNEDNEGHIMAALFNTGKASFSVKKGDRIVQGIFCRYLTADDDSAEGKRSGGIGSTGI